MTGWACLTGMMRRLHHWIVLLAGLCLPLAGTAAPLENRLANHLSPYLALHGADPVAWQEWNTASVARARQEGKLLFVSIGYFSCHWCHVMQRESYRNAEIARFLNAHFIPVKVDRELDPALDARLIDFAEKTRGISGWPLNAFVTPDGYPLYATLYHPPQEFLQVLQRLQQLWQQERDELRQMAQQAAVTATGPGQPRVDPAQARARAAQVVAEAFKLADTVQGGFGDQSKFPQVPQLEFLLGEHVRKPDPRLADFLALTLDAMAHNGLQDHLGGGFFRYTTDPSWKTPHFEKMLYDNAQLASLYLRAARVLGRAEYREIGLRTMDFVLRELRDPGGGYIAALSALDQHGVEGGAYLWKESELKSLLKPEEIEAYRRYAGMSDAPPFDGGWLPLGNTPVSDVARQLKRDPTETAALIRSAEIRLREVRAHRKVPRDTKVIAAWNGLVLSALVTGSQEDNRFREAAQAQQKMLISRFWDGSKLLRSRVGNQAGGQVSLEDYAYVAAGLSDWAALSGQKQDWKVARSVARAGWAAFYGPRGWRLEESSLLSADNGQDIITDGPMPSPSAMLIRASLRIAEALHDPELQRQSLAAANSGHRLIAESPFWYASGVAVQVEVTRHTAR